MPIALLDHSCLPLAYIDTNGRAIEGLEPRLFSARIAALEPGLPEVRRSRRTPVLIAHSEFNASMYAVERVQLGIYALCRLGDWVTHQDIRRLQTMSLENIPPRKEHAYEQANATGNDWWRRAAIPPSHASQRRRSYDSQKQKFAKLENFRLCLTTPITSTPELDLGIQETSPQVAQEHVPFTLVDMLEDPFPEDTRQEPEEVLGMIKAQYQEALYVSKVKGLTCSTNITNADSTRHH